MPRGLNHSGDFRHGNPVPATDPKFDSNPVTWTPDPKHFGNVVTQAPNPVNFGNAVNWPIPNPAHFGNPVTLP